MDIAYYLSELLEQLGEVNVPGLGSFTRVKVDGYYNSDEGRFYPPTSKLEFTQQYVDDDVLTQYIGVKKRISLASSKYFTEKYISGLKQEVVSREIPFAELGSLFFANGRIQFRASQSVPDPEFYGYPTISLNKKGAEPVYAYEEPVAEPVATPEPEPVEEELPAHVYEPFTEDDHLHEQVNTNEPEVKNEPVEEELLTYEHTTPYEPEQSEPAVEEHDAYFAPQPEVTAPQAEEEDDFIFHSAAYVEPATEEEGYEEVEEEEEQRRSYLWLWITLIVLALAGGGFYGWYYYQQQQHTQPVKKIKATPAAAPKDTTDSASTTPPTVKDTAAAANGGKVTPAQNAPPSTIDSTKKRYEIIAAETKTQKEADRIVKNYRSIGIQAHVVTDAPGKRKKVSLGTYDSPTGVNAAMNDLLKTGKVNKGIWPLPINPKK